MLSAVSGVFAVSCFLALFCVRCVLNSKTDPACTQPPMLNAFGTPGCSIGRSNFEFARSKRVAGLRPWASWCVPIHVFVALSVRCMWASRCCFAFRFRALQLLNGAAAALGQRQLTGSARPRPAVCLELLLSLELGLFFSSLVCVSVSICSLSADESGSSAAAAGHVGAVCSTQEPATQSSRSTRWSARRAKEELDGRDETMA